MMARVSLTLSRQVVLVRWIETDLRKWRSEEKA